MKVLGALLWVIAFVLSTIVSYHVTAAAAPDYLGRWTFGIVLLCVSMACMIAAEIDK
jgi:multisubunit Na+/H+ antiporter MnhE subunit